jgi:hypothetical protein
MATPLLRWSHVL